MKLNTHFVNTLKNIDRQQIIHSTQTPQQHSVPTLISAKKVVKHMYQIRGMADTLRMRTTISPGQWQPWTAVSPLLWLISMA